MYDECKKNWIDFVCIYREIIVLGIIVINVFAYDKFASSGGSFDRSV